MPLSCNCGAVLPEDARFCHKCGKPQYEEDIARLNTVEETPVQVLPPIVPPPELKRRVGFANLRAVGVTMAVAVGALGALAIAGRVTPLLVPLVLCAAGFVAARFYGKRSPEPLTPFGGATLGVMTGFWLFLVILVCTVYLSTPEGRVLFRASMGNLPNSAVMAKLSDDPQQFTAFLMGSLVPAFFITTISGAFGGILAARLQTRGGPTR